MYMPTFRQGFNHNDINNLTENIFNIKNDYDDKKLNEFLSKNNYLLCIKPHPGELSKSQIIETDNIKMVSEEEMICLIGTKMGWGNMNGNPLLKLV